MNSVPSAGFVPPRWPILLGLYALTVAVNLVGITWGLPGQAGNLLPSVPAPGAIEAADRSWSAVRDAARDLNFGPPDPDRSETLIKVFRRFRLYTADPDEVVAMMAVARLNPLKGRWDPGFSQYGGLFLYSLGASFKLASVLGAVTLRGDPSYYLEHPEAMGRLYLVGRLLVVLVGALAIPLLWLLARPLYGPRTAALGAGVAAVVPAWIAWSHVMKPVAFGTPFALAALLAGARLVAAHRPGRWAVGGGLLTGLAAGAALHYLLVLLGPWVAIALRRTESIGRRLAIGAAAAGTAGVSLLALHPYWFIAPERTAAGWKMVLGWYEPSYDPGALAAFAWGSLGPALGLPLVVVGALEAALLLWRGREVLPILAPAFALLVAAGVKTGGIPGDPLHARLVLPALLVLAMLAVGGLWRVGRRLPRATRGVPFLVVVPTLLISVAVLRNFVLASGPEGVRTRAGAWMNALPEGISIGVLAPLAPFRSPFFRADRYHLVLNDHPGQPGGSSDPEYFLIAERSEMATSPGFLDRFQEVQRFVPPPAPLGDFAQAVYPFAQPRITIYARRVPGD